jgi:malate dehydrogenase
MNPSGNRRRKIALLGAGQIGGTLAHICATRRLGDIVLLDVVDGVAKGKALDLWEGTPLLHSDTRLVAGKDPELMSGADLVIITAGFPRKPGMSRDELLDRNLEVIADLARKVQRYAPDSFVIVVTNPLDAMVYAFYRVSGFPKERVVGMAGVLDSSRFRAFVAEACGVSVEDVYALVLGGHGDDMVPLPRYSHVAGLPLEFFLSSEEIARIIERTRKAGGEIVELLGTGSAFYSPALSAIEMAEAYLFDRRRILPVAAYLEGEYGFSGIFLGVPALISGKGVERVLEIPLTSGEKEELRKSAERVQKLISEVDFRLSSARG